MTWRGTFVLLLLLAVLGGLLWRSERGPAPGMPSRVALVAAPSTLTALQITAAGVTHRVEREGDRWRRVQGSPVSREVPSLVEALGALAPIMVVAAEPASPEEFGFDSDAVRLVAWAGATPVLDLEIGARNPARTAVYVRRHGAQPVELVGALLDWELAKVLGRAGGKNTLTKRRETGEPS